MADLLQSLEVYMVEIVADVDADAFLVHVEGIAQLVLDAHGVCAPVAFRTFASSVPVEAREGTVPGGLIIVSTGAGGGAHHAPRGAS